MADAPEVVPDPISTLEAKDDSQKNLIPRKSVPGFEKRTLSSDTDKVAVEREDTDKFPVESHSDLIPVQVPGLSNDNVHELAVLPQRRDTLGRQEEPFRPRAIEPDDGDQIATRTLLQQSQSQSQLRLSVPTEEWKFGFWDLCGNGSLGFEAVSCPCVVAGRTYSRIKEPDNDHRTSTNGYCVGCCALVVPGIIGLPLYWMMTVATRREVRYRYNLKGDNCDDCWRASLCIWCALAQEEREVVARERLHAEEARTGGAPPQYSQKDTKMAYEPGTPA